jgi:sugar phosphate isomerase/epimerase
MNFTGNPIGVQLYSLRDICATDFIGTLKQVAALGYGAVEFAGLHNHKAADIKAVLDEAGLKAPSFHMSHADLRKNFDQAISDFVKTLGCKYAVIPSGPKDYSDGGERWKKFCADVREMKKRCADAGVQLAYHNHPFEFEAIGDKDGYHYMFHDKPEESPLAEVDICWVAAAKRDPITEIRKLKGRVKLVHVKDLDPGPPPRDTEVGSGILQWPAIYKACEEAGVEHLIVERDKPEPPSIESIKKSLAFLKQQGLEK